MQNILDFLTSHPVRSAIVIRHAERFEIKGNDAHYTTGLTDKGLADAFDIGIAMPMCFDSYRLFHSEAKRCCQTAERICEALRLRGADARIAGPEDVIGISYMLADINTAFDESERHGKGFIRAWFGGQLKPGIYKPLVETRDEHLAYLRARLSENFSSRHLDIHVTHDWNINVLREGIFGLRHEDIGWPDFLSGLGFSQGQGGLDAILFDGKTVRRHEI